MTTTTTDERTEMLRQEADARKRYAPTLKRWFGRLVEVVAVEGTQVDVTYHGAPAWRNMVRGAIALKAGRITAQFHDFRVKFDFCAKVEWVDDQGRVSYEECAYDHKEVCTREGHMSAMAALRWFMGQSARAQVDALSERDRFGVAQALSHAEGIAPISNVYEAIAAAEARRADLACPRLYSADLSAFVDANNPEYRARRARAEELAAEEVAQAVDAILNHMEGL